MPLSSAFAQPSTAVGGSLAVYPLDEFYALERKPLPAIQAIGGDEMPEPYRTLLVHTNDMTPTLEAFYGRKVQLSVLRRQQRDDLYFREVVLSLEGTGEPVEFGAIRINLALFPPKARRAILEERLPLGRILAEHQIVHASRPKAFLRVEADSFMKSALKLSGTEALYGRRNSLADPVQRSLAEIVEILPSVSPRV